MSGIEPTVVWRLSDEDARAGRHALWWSTGPGGELAVMLVDGRHLDPERRLRTPFDAELVVVSATGERRTPVEGIEMRPWHLALLPGGRFLLTSGHTAPDERGAWEDNTVAFSASGRPVGPPFCLGDDIEVVVTDRCGRIWTAYGDQGVYGRHPESRSGLAGWNTEGAATWFPSKLPSLPLGAGAGATEGEAVWMAWYSHEGRFLSRIDPADGTVTSYHDPADRTDGIAVRGNRAILSHRFHNTPTVRLTRAELMGTTWEITGQEQVLMPGGAVLQRAQGRDGVLWLRAGDTWSRVEV
ncbi:hypothetical protein OOK31_32860 [Streptomyces sp. NBC_00249]|uniref:hypothetical protein n=1 Tax=Streptomyces sp. NBC_00249 TaxID=2975690 RepID=UPI00225242F6|nr:hypothetical protein [Streptomyces sp. NBC_00249]MCX5198624.1 hypothetical protein [Streptomyces sp. NBC_00249]